MFNYMGSKYWLARHYPEPRYATIVEPFAGSAQYSLRYWEKKVILIEKEEGIFNLWRWLQRATSQEILDLPVPQPGETIVHPVEEARWLIALAMNRGTYRPEKRAGSWPQLPDLWERKKEIIASSLHKIRHWDVRLGDYRDAPNIVATWFVDPPYKGIWRPDVGDYNALAEWCRKRSGQTIVCETTGADWLPFREFRKSKTMKGRRAEVIWTG